jgi:hypothetical protein
MTPPTPFILPTGLSLAIGGNSLVVRHSGDIVLEQSLGRRISRIESEGDMTLRFGPITGVLRCKGVLRCEGPVEAEEIRAGEVHLAAHSVTAHAIVADRCVVIDAAVLDVDVIVAPEVIIDPRATGRVRIIDCFNERPPLRVRGCLSLEEFEADFGGAAEFLAHRGVIPLHPLPEPTSSHHEASEASLSIEATARPGRSPLRGLPLQEAAAAAEQDDLARASAARRPPPTHVGRPTDRPTAPTQHVPAGDYEETQRTVVPLPEPRPARSTRPLDPARPTGPARADDRPGAPNRASASPARATEPTPLRTSSAGTQPVEPRRAPVPVAEERPPFIIAARRDATPLHPRELGRQAPRIRKLVQRVASAYDHPPEPVVALESLTHFERVTQLPEQLDELWLALLRQHLASGSSPPPQVTLAMNALHALVFG